MPWRKMRCRARCHHCSRHIQGEQALLIWKGLSRFYILDPQHATCQKWSIPLITYGTWQNFAARFLTEDKLIVLRVTQEISGVGLAAGELQNNSEWCNKVGYFGGLEVEFKLGQVEFEPLAHWNSSRYHLEYYIASWGCCTEANTELWMPRSCSCARLQWRKPEFPSVASLTRIYNHHHIGRFHPGHCYPQISENFW